MGNNPIKKFAEWAPALAFGVALLYWEGYVFLRGYFNAFEIDPALTDLTLQDILTTGVWSIIILLIRAMEFFLFLLFVLFKPPWVPINIFTALILLLCSLLLVLVTSYMMFNGARALWVRFENWPSVKFVASSIVAIVLLLIAPFYAAGTVSGSSPLISRLASSNFSYSVFTSQPSVYVNYKGPAVKSAYIVTYSQDLVRDNPRLQVSCDENSRCIVSQVFDECIDDTCGGTYRMIFETREYIFLKPSGWDCAVFPPAVSRMARQDKDVQYPQWNCKTVALPKSRVLSIFRI